MKREAEAKKEKKTRASSELKKKKKLRWPRETTKKRFRNANVFLGPRFTAAPAPLLRGRRIPGRRAGKRAREGAEEVENRSAENRTFNFNRQLPSITSHFPLKKTFFDTSTFSL